MENNIKTKIAAGGLSLTALISGGLAYKDKIMELIHPTETPTNKNIDIKTGAKNNTAHGGNATQSVSGETINITN